MKVIDVTAAVIQRSGLILIAQRKNSGHLPGKWEFPGGKIEKDEDPKECLARELCEEFEIEALIGDKLHENVHYYPDKAVRLISFLVESFEGEIVVNEHEDVHWVAPEKLIDYDLAEADIPIAEKLLTIII